jgi:hypothetical protein
MNLEARWMSIIAAHRVGEGISTGNSKHRRNNQEKSKRKDGERTTLVNPIPCGRSIGKPQAFAVSLTGVLVGAIPSSFCLTINDLRLRCGTKW